jgi:hypothetical protein
LYFADRGIEALESKLYSWNNATGLFSLVQNFPAINAEGVEVFAFGGNTYLVFADYAGTGVSTVIYRWSGSQFVEFQSIAHSGIVSELCYLCILTCHSFPTFKIGNTSR